MSLGQPQTNGNGRRARIAVVLPGGGARGAYEVGAMSVLLPALEARGERVSVWCGTSVGAINAAALASLADAPAHAQVDEFAEMWRQMRKNDVMSHLVGVGGLRTLVRMLGHALGIPGAGFAGLLDPSPLRASLDRWIDWTRLQGNVREGVVEAACVVATSVSTGEPVAFVATRSALPAPVDDNLRYVATDLRGEHVRASAAIPMLFPTVEITEPRSSRGHYLDGGTRLNSPIKPALNLGAERVIVVGLEPFAPAIRRPVSGRAPGIADIAANVLDGLLVDQVAQDLRRLAAINSFFVEDARSGVRNSSRVYRLARGHPPYRPISYALVAPRRHGEIGRVAERIFASRYGGLRALRSPDFTVLARALGAGTRARGELLSFLLFDPEFVAALIEMGRRDARRWLRRHPAFWCRDASHDLSIAAYDRDRVAEQEAIDEFRGLRRH